MQTNGSVVSIHIAPEETVRPAAVAEARIEAGKGIVGDRYYRPDGHTDPGHEITLIQIESIEALRHEHGLDLAPGDARRQVVTRGVELNPLVGREFTVGETTLRGIRLNEPCDHLASLTDRRVLKGLVHRGGLRAQIVRGGTIRPGDAIVASAAEAAPGEAAGS